MSSCDSMSYTGTIFSFSRKKLHTITSLNWNPSKAHKRHILMIEKEENQISVLTVLPNFRYMFLAKLDDLYGHFFLVYS